MLDQLMQLDEQLLLLINGAHAPFWDGFMRTFSGKWVWVPMYAALLWAVWRSYPWRVALVMTLGAVAVIAAADQTCATLIRPLVQRVRPTQPDNPLSALMHIVDGYRGGHYGFPSCHAANSLGLATFMCLLMPRRRWMIFILSWAALNCYTRMYLGVHYPGDIIVGGIIGATEAAIIFLLTTAAVRLWAAPEGIRRIPPLRELRIGSRSIYYRPFDAVILTGIVTTAGIALSAAMR